MMAAPLLEGIAMELVLSEDDPIDFLGREDAEEFVVIALQHLLQLYLLTVALLDSLLEGSLVSRLVLTSLLHLIIKKPLLSYHASFASLLLLLCLSFLSAYIISQIQKSWR